MPATGGAANRQRAELDAVLGGVPRLRPTGSCGERLEHPEELMLSVRRVAEVHGGQAQAQPQPSLSNTTCGDEQTGWRTAGAGDARRRTATSQLLATRGS